MTSPGRVLLIGNFQPNNGIFSPSEALAVELRRAGWQVLTASARTGRAAWLLDLLATILQRRRDYDLAQVSVFSGLAFAWAEASCALLRRLGKPYVLTLHGGNLPAFARDHARRVRRLLRGAVAVTTPSHFLREALAGFRADIHLIPNALELAGYEPRPRSPVGPRLGWLRAFHAVYNPTMAVEAIASLKDDFPDLRLTMIGPDKGDGALAETRRAAERLGVADRLAIPGALPKAQVPGALAQFDLFLNTTNAESFGVGVVEAAALGLCIVTTCVGELSYIWADGETALLVPPGDAGAMAAAIRRVLTDPALAEKLSRGARATAEQYDWPRVLPLWERLLSEVGGAAAS